MTHRLTQLPAIVGVIVVLASCASPQKAQPLLTQRVSFGQVEMQLADNWGVYAIVEDQTSPDVDEIDHVVMNAAVRP